MRYRDKNWRELFRKSVIEMVGESPEKRREYWLKIYPIKEDEIEKMEVFNKFLEFENDIIDPTFEERSANMSQDELFSYYKDCHNTRVKLKELCGKYTPMTRLFFGGYMKTEDEIKKEIENGI